MIRINLLTEGRGAKKGGVIQGPKPAAAAGGDGAPPWPLYIAILLLCVAGVAGYGTWLFLQNHALKGKIADQQTELKRYEGAREKVTELEKKKTEYSAKLDQVKQLKDQQSIPVKLMNRLVEVLPEGAWYSSVKQGDLNLITVEGKAKSIKTISTLYDNLSGVIEFGEVQAGDISQISGGEEVYSFGVKFSYYPGGVRPKPAGEVAPVAKPAAKAKKSSGSESAE